MSNRRADRFGDSSELTIVFTPDASNLKPNDSRKLAENIDDKDLLQLLQKEIEQSSLYYSAWNEAVRILKGRRMIKSTEDFNSCLKIAVCCYTVEMSQYKQFYSHFNQLCRTLNTKNWNSFPYKSMWIMLKKAINDDLIKSNPPVDIADFKSFRGLRFHIPENQIPKVGEWVYSKQYMSTSVNSTVATNFAQLNGTLIEIIGKPEMGKGIQDYSQFTSEGEVLFAPWEMFSVISVDTTNQLHKIVLRA